MVAGYLGVGKKSRPKGGGQMAEMMAQLRADAGPGMFADGDVLDGLPGLTLDFAALAARAQGEPNTRR